MALVQFENNSAPYINAENLNNNFEYLEKLNNYSTDEIVVGKWINGKPLYRKVFVGNITQAQIETGVYSVNSGLSVDFSRVKSAELIRDNANQDILENNVYLSSGSAYFSVFYRKSDNTFQFRGATYSGQYIITLEYTKTTD